ncbi:4-hydroxythreonine-4-phosphate dehydrogenase PdxA [Salinisphaera sp. USBA-960]|uniref:4-hydroxythreonine-4-phosphate dehydrogenase PdxA n=1 Tax=Salinisphaera orenii TaxID=856731 RepID=UPI000DBE0FFB|nr:4-hydroxythreonine-4-phosphate dehydrogenase PdxA [Salifodinibacter halophilus]NNC26663.1 4-hydroxythreonine-4-phosphate dehydrogenase PdxA [Salifodinibacter halophilus]
MSAAKRLIITPGEPAGVGPDLTLALAQHDWPFELVAVADPDMLAQRSRALGYAIDVTDIDYNQPPSAHRAGVLPVDPIACERPVTAGQLDTANAAYVRQTLDRGCDRCLNGTADALVTAPVHKATLTRGGEAFNGHTQYLAARCHAPPPVMLLTTADGSFRVALATMHLPLRDVANALTVDGLRHVFRTTAASLQQDFGIAAPRLLVTGLNPHAGESGTLGAEEIQTIAPAIEAEKESGLRITGPLSADTAFIDDNRAGGDVVVAMFHDQGLPAIKYAGFGRVVNVTLGLPIVRTSVDHGTAVELAGTGHADSASLFTAVETAAAIANSRGA